MDERQKLQHLFQFDLWCNRKLAELINEHAPFEEQDRSVALLSHIINAQKIWFRRVLQTSVEEEVGLWHEYELGELKHKARKTNRRWMNFIADNEVDLNAEIPYQNSKGTSYSNSVWQICNHLIIHGQHHRAQISLLLRNCDIEPPEIDYIFYARSEQLQHA